MDDLIVKLFLPMMGLLAISLIIYSVSVAADVLEKRRERAEKAKAAAAAAAEADKKDQ